VADLELDFHLHPQQLEVLNSPARFTVTVAGRRWGKSILAGTRACLKALDPKNTQRKPVLIVAPIATQAKSIFWGWLLEKLHPVIKNYQSNEGLIYLNNGVVLGVKGADRPDTLRGLGPYHVEMDEFADMKVETWEAILRPALVDAKGTAGFTGTPKGRSHFYDLFKHADESGDPDWAAFHFQTVNNPFLDPAEIEKARSTMPGWLFRQEFMASFETGGSGSFLREWLKYTDDEPTHTVMKLGVARVEPIPGDWYVAVDLGGFAAIESARGYKQRRLDQTAISVVKILEDGRWYVRDVYLGRWSVNETAKRILDAVESVKTMNLGIEKGALFNAVAPELQSQAAQRGIFCRPEPLSHNNQSKVERIGWALQGRMEHGKVLFRRAPWNRDVEDQFINFPSALVHDDAPDSLAFIVQLAEARVFENFAHVSDEPYWQPTDAHVGY